MDNAKTFYALGGQAEVHLYIPKDCSAMQGAVRCLTIRQLYQQNIPTLPPSSCACNNGVVLVTPNPLAEAQASTSSVTALFYLTPLLSHCVPFHRINTRSRLPLGLGIGGGGLVKYKDVVA
jgi:hypothetical protein